MLSIGEALRDAREAKGISLEQAEEDTKIRKRYLRALEEGDYSILPGMVYAKGFLRNYANYLGLNQEEIMIEYKLLHKPVRENESRANIEEIINKRRASNRVNRKAYLITVIVAVIAIITFALYSMLVKKDTEAPKTGVAGNEVKTGQQAQNNNNQTGSIVNGGIQGNKPEGSKAGSPEQPETLPEEDEGKVKLVLKGTEASWIKVYVDGTVKFTGVLKAGETKTFTAVDKIKFRSGNAGGTEVTFNGQDLGVLGPMGKVVDREFTSQTDGELKQNR